jgi:O-antigen/teichoic acid export membrane protein
LVRPGRERHRLGDEAFGIWILIFSITGYYGLFDLGIRSSIVRYVARYSTVNDEDELNRLINTAMFSYSGIGAVALVITLTVTYYVTSIFKIPPEFVVTARWLLLMVGAAVSLGFPLGVFGGILDGPQRFYLMNVTSVSATLLRAPLIILALRHGGGLSVAFVTVSLPLLSALVNATVVFCQVRAARLAVCEQSQPVADRELKRDHLRDPGGRTPALQD